MGKVTRSISREIKNLTCEIICLENQQNGNEISLFMRPTHYAPHYQGRNVEKFVILDVTPNNVKGYEFTSDTQNVHDTIEIIEFNEHLSITTYRPQS